jgi:hypothetical protein
MQIALIHRWAAGILVAAYVIIYVVRLIKLNGGPFSYHFGPTFIGGRQKSGSMTSKCIAIGLAATERGLSK